MLYHLTYEMPGHFVNWVTEADNEEEAMSTLREHVYKYCGQAIEDWAGNRKPEEIMAEIEKNGVFQEVVEGIINLDQA